MAIPTARKGWLKPDSYFIELKYSLERNFRGGWLLLVFMQFLTESFYEIDFKSYVWIYEMKLQSWRTLNQIIDNRVVTCFDSLLAGILIDNLIVGMFTWNSNSMKLFVRRLRRRRII